MAMALDEPGHDEPAAELDDARLRAGEPGDLVIGADGDDPVTLGGHRLHLGPRWIHGDDLAAAQHQVRRPRGLVRLADAPRGASREGEGHGEEHPTERAQRLGVALSLLRGERLALAPGSLGDEHGQRSIPRASQGEAPSRSSIYHHAPSGGSRAILRRWSGGTRSCLPSRARIAGPRALHRRRRSPMRRSGSAATTSSRRSAAAAPAWCLSLIHISEPTRLLSISYAV